MGGDSVAVVKVTNLSQNVSVVGSIPLGQGDSQEACDGDAIGFVKPERAEACRNSMNSSRFDVDSDGNDAPVLMPFLTFRLVSPQPPAPLPSWVMTKAPSFLVGDRPSTPPAEVVGEL